MQKTTPKSKDNEKVSRKKFNSIQYQHRQSTTVMYTKELIRQSSKNCKISQALDGIQDDLLQMDSFDSSDNNFKDYSLKKVQERFRKRTPGHTSYF